MSVSLLEGIQSIIIISGMVIIMVLILVGDEIVKIIEALRGEESDDDE